MGVETWFSKNGQTVLTVIGIGCSIAATVLSVRAGSKIEKELDETKPTETKDKAKVYVKHLWLPAALEAGGVIATLGSNHIRNQQLATALLTASTATTALSETNKKVREKFGNKESENIKKEVSTEKVRKDLSQQAPDGLAQNAKKPGDILCYESITGQYFWSNATKIKEAEVSCLYEMMDGSELSVTDWLAELGLDKFMPGSLLEHMYWDQNDHQFAVIIGTCIGPDEQTPCLLVQYRRDPRIEPDTVWQR